MNRLEFLEKCISIWPLYKQKESTYYPNNIMPERESNTTVNTLSISESKSQFITNKEIAE